MHSYVTPADDAPLGVRKRGLSKGKAGSVREQVESWKVRGKIGRVGNLAKSRGLWMAWMVLVDFCALGGRCARGHWHTGKRKGEGKGGKAKILGFGPWSLVLLVRNQASTMSRHCEKEIQVPSSVLTVTCIHDMLKTTPNAERTTVCRPA